MKQPLVFSGVQTHLGSTWSVLHGVGMGCHGRCCPEAHAEGLSNTGDSTGAQVEKVDMGSCLMKIIVWIALEIKAHSLCQLVQVRTSYARAPQCHSCQPAFKCEGCSGASGFPFVLQVFAGEPQLCCCHFAASSSFWTQDLVLIRID